MTKYLLLLLLPAHLSAQSLFDSLYAKRTATLYFDTGKSELRAEGGLTLDSLVRELHASPAALRIRITAFTDSVGAPAANLALSRRRAETVRAALQQRGLAAAKIEVSGLGEQNPAAANNTEEGRQHNRRAQLEIMAAVPMARLRGQVKDPETGKGIADATVTFRSKLRSDSTRTDTAGYYSVRLPKDSVISIDAEAKSYFFQSTVLHIFGSPELYRKYNLSPDISLPKAGVGEKAVLRNLYFVGDLAVLLKVSEPELPKVLRFMQLNPDLKVEIAGHINEPGMRPDQLSPWKWKLSTDRAKLVYDYLVQNGIAPTRMRYKGYGNTEMLFPLPTATAEEQQQNRRVEIRVIE